jgi:hypothetical protein
MYCLGCTDLGQVWVEFKNDAASKKIEESNEDVLRDRTYNLIFSGRFYAVEKKYGHFGKYRFKFVAESTKKAKLIGKVGSDPSKWSEKERKKICSYMKEVEPK